MPQAIEVVFENGVLRPLEPLTGQFREREHLTVTIERAPERSDWLAGAVHAGSLDAVRRALGKTSGTIAELVRSEREER